MQAAFYKLLRRQLLVRFVARLVTRLGLDHRWGRQPCHMSSSGADWLDAGCLCQAV